MYSFLPFYPIQNHIHHDDSFNKKKKLHVSSISFIQVKHPWCIHMMMMIATLSLSIYIYIYHQQDWKFWKTKQTLKQIDWLT